MISFADNVSEVSSLCMTHRRDICVECKNGVFFVWMNEVRKSIYTLIYLLTYLLT